MEVSFKYDKKLAMINALAFAIALVLYIMTRFPLFVLLGFGVGFFLLTAFSLKVNKWNNLWAAISAILLYIAGPLFTTFCIQYTILEPELYKKTKTSKWALNFICVAIAYMLVLAVIGSVRWAWYVTHTFFLIAAFTDYFVYEFRQNEITFGDLTTIDTGLSVAKNYDFVLHNRGAVVLLLTVLAFMLIWELPTKFGTWWLQHIVLRLVALVAAFIMIGYIQDNAMGIATQTWEKKGTYRNGFVLNFILGIQDSMIDPPKGYSEDAIKELEDEYSNSGAETETETEVETESESESEANAAADTKTQTGGSEAKAKALAEEVANGRKPTIITIMNESFADFKIMGDLTTNKEVTPFIDSLSENTTRGYALSSVFGAKTPNSEWEYMTGNTMAFLPSGSVVYQQYLDDQPTSLVSTLKNEGYKTVAMHPYFAAGWRRNTVYPRLGFDEQYFMDDENSIFDSSKIYREYITDEEMYKALIQEYEAKDKEDPLFIMSITMQNHGGYKDLYPNFPHDVQYNKGGAYYTDADQYLSLINKTDTATKELLEYFSQVDEPVEIVFFGDHLPSLSNSFFKSLNGKGTSGLTLSELEKLFSVPFFIWTNYDTPENTVERSSLNYLSTMALKVANIELPAYNQFLDDMMKVIPAINSRGYMNAKGKYAHVSDAKGEEKEWINKYNILQYNRMFDEDNKSYVFSPYIDGLADNADDE